jgi:Ni/Co efflux regulator RcnB
MKRIATTALAALIAAGSLSTGVASAQSYRDRDVHDARREVREERRDVREERRELRDARGDLRQERRESRWDQRRHNGYYANGRYYRGQPPAWAYQRGDYRPAYQSWRRGERLPSYYRSHYREIDWRRAHYRQPPRGYHYVRDDNTGEVLLVAIATGVILSILLNQ